MNEKLIELFKNKKFMLIFSGFIALIGLVLILKRKSPESEESNNAENEEKKRIREQKKTIRELERKNRELEEKANGKSITGNDSKGKQSKIKSDDSGEEGQGKTTGVNEDESIESDEPK